MVPGHGAVDAGRSEERMQARRRREGWIVFAVSGLLAGCPAGPRSGKPAAPAPPREAVASPATGAHAAGGDHAHGGAKRQALAARVLAPARGPLERSRRPMAAISLEPMAHDDPLASKVGGRPYLAPGEALPRGGDGRPLFLLAQVDFAQVPPLPGYPDSGLLQVFIADDDLYGANFDQGQGVAAQSVQRDFRVVYRPAPLRPMAADAPAADATGDESLPFDPRKPRRMRFTAGSETVSGDDVHFPGIAGADPYALAQRYAQAHRLEEDEVAEALAEALRRPGHKLGGYPFFTQADPRKRDDPHVLLLQLDTDGDMMWGDSGVANFFIRPDDLARRDFSRVVYNWDCF